MCLRNKIEFDNAIKLLNSGAIYKSSEEWRISTIMETEIKPEICTYSGHSGETWYRVKVKCDILFECLSPTIERAIEFAMIFQSKTADFFYQYGWSSWVKKDLYRIVNEI